MTSRLVVPDNITLVPPPRAQQRNPVGSVRQFMRDNGLPSRVFARYDDIRDHRCETWNRLVERPRTIRSVGMRDRAHRS